MFLSLWKYTKNFSKREFRCSHCKKVDMDWDFMVMLQVARDIAGIPFRITSGWRCSYWNAQVGGSDTSSHLYGVACDIACATSDDRFTIVSALLRAGFVRIGIGEDFIHVDLSDRRGEVTKFKALWLY